MTRFRSIGWTLAGVLLLALAPDAQSSDLSRIFVTVQSAAGAPVAGVKATDLLLKVDNIDRRIVDVQPATGPVSVVIAADAAIEDAPHLRAAGSAISATLKRRSPDSQLAVLRLASPPVSFVAASAPAADQDRMIDYLSATTTQSYADGILEAARALAQAESQRRVIFVMTRRTAPLLESAVNELRASGAAIWGVQIAPIVRPGERYAIKTAAAVSGGMAEVVVDAAHLPAQAERLINALLSQYMVTFEAPSPGGRGDLRVGIRRDGALIAAPSWTLGK